MSHRDIVAGDLVIVVASGCGCQSIDINLVLEVKALSIEATECVLCRLVQAPEVTAELHFGGRKAWKPLRYLRKINPPPVYVEDKEEAFA